jgi:hypothetical protein
MPLTASAFVSGRPGAAIYHTWNFGQSLNGKRILLAFAVRVLLGCVAAPADVAGPHDEVPPRPLTSVVAQPLDGYDHDN